MGLKRIRKPSDDALTRVRWDQLESILAVYYKNQGYQVEHVGTGGASGQRYDGGIDLKLRKGDEYVVVQVKHWNTRQVPHNEVHQLLGVMTTQQATRAILLTSGEFTHAAKLAANKAGQIELVDGRALRDMVGPLVDIEKTELAPAKLSLVSGFRMPKKKEDIPLGVRLLLVAISFLVMLWVIRTAIGNFNNEMHKLSQQSVARAEAAAHKAQAAQTARPNVVHVQASKPVQPLPSVQAEVSQPKYETWGAPSQPRVEEVSAVGPKETAAERKAREAYLRAIPEV